MQNNLISVIIPMYNAEETIVRCIKSVESQKCDFDLEIIVINDGSTDNSLSIVSDYLKESNSEIILVSQENKGASAARNKGIELAKGKFIALLDSDDVWLDGKLAAQMNIFENNEVDFVGTLHNNLQLGFPYRLSNDLFELTFRKLMIKMAPSTITAVFKKELIEKSGNYDESQKYCEDGNLWLRFSKVGKMVVINKNFAIAGDLKPLYGHSGLSGNLAGMHEGEIKNLKDMLELGYVNYLQYLLYFSYVKIKYFRRVLIVKLR